MDVAGAQATSLQVAELVEQKQGMVAGAAEVAVVGRALLVAIGRADARIQVENHLLRRAAVVNPVDPKPGQIGKGGEVVVGRQELGLEAAHLAADAACLVTAPPPTIHHMAGSCPRRSASLTSS
jgi:hypothetical protein